MRKPANFEDWPREVQEEFDHKLASVQIAGETRTWHRYGTEGSGRPKQLPPDDPRHHLPWTHPDTGITYRCGCQTIDTEWLYWILLTGRGFGKTMAGSNWIIDGALKHPGSYWAIVAPTQDMLERNCFFNSSGVIEQLRPQDMLGGSRERAYNQNKHRLTLANKTIIQGFSAAQPERIRGANLYGVWVDELAQIDEEHPDFFEINLEPALRIGESKMIVTTTPKQTKIIRDFKKLYESGDPLVHMTTAASFENPYYNKRKLDQKERQLKGSSIYDQEYRGILLDEVDGSLFRKATINKYRMRDIPDDLTSVVVAVDPATTAKTGSDETGIIVAGSNRSRHYFCLADYSFKGTQKEIADRVISVYSQWQADWVVGEKNAGGDWLKESLDQAAEDSGRADVPFRAVSAMRNKIMRANPISHAMESGHIHMIGDPEQYEELEAQLCAIVLNGDRSKKHDDRADAFVWAMTELLGLSGTDYAEVYTWKCRHCDALMTPTYKHCRECGRERPEQPKTDDSPRRQKRTWSEAYFNTCNKCGERYNVHERTCPKCAPSPATYMKQVMVFSGQVNTAGLYTGKNWFKGRKI
jgi:predicted phage terminase large subunit-like protein